MQQGQELGHNAFDRIGDIHLIAIELNFVLLNLDVVLNFGKMSTPVRLKRIINIEVDVEERILAHGIEAAVETCVILVVEVSRFAGPLQGIGFINDIVLISLHTLPVFPFGLFTKGNFNG